MTPQKIDAHHHFWQISRGDYIWLDSERSALHRDYLPHDLAPLFKCANVAGSILVQAAPTESETRYLLELASQTSHVLGVVGWIDFKVADAPARVAHAAAQDKCVGLRPMLQNMPSADWVLQPQMSPVFEAVCRSGLTLDALIRSDQIAAINRLAARYPDMRIVLNHCAKPRIAAQKFDAWAADIRDIAQNGNVYCKFSGLTSEAGKNWEVDQFKPYFDVVWTSFGADRVLWGSDWPACLPTSTYESWCNACEHLTSGLTADEQAGFYRGNVYRAYSLDGG